LVKAVGATHDLDEDGAVAYLQLLALPDPTTKNMRLWNDWTAGRLKKALTALTARELVIAAKRSRAGRGHFLPGGWVEKKTPHLPFETWKLPFYGLAGFSVPLPFEAVLPLAPLHRVFERAWARVEAGDPPAYEKV
jgi:hypothetical protein